MEGARGVKRYRRVFIERKKPGFKSSYSHQLFAEDCNTSSKRQPGWSLTKGSLTISLLCWGISSIGFPSVSISTSRSRSSSTTPSMVEVRRTSAAPVILSGRSAPGLTCDLLYEATWPCLKPRPVASGLEASVSPDRLFGTHCLCSMLKTHLFHQAYA